MKSKNGGTTQINLRLLDHVEVRLEAFVGGTTMKVAELAALNHGDVVRLDSSLGHDIEIRMNDVIIASGELVAVEDNFAVKIVSLAEN